MPHSRDRAVSLSKLHEPHYMSHPERTLFGTAHAPTLAPGCAALDSAAAPSRSDCTHEFPTIIMAMVLA